MASLKAWSTAALLTSPSCGDFVIRRKMGNASSVAADSPLANLKSDVRLMDSATIEAEFLNIDVLTEDKLLELSGATDLASVHSLTFRVDSRDQSVSQLGELLPKLRRLTLDRSILHSFRDLGVSLRSLRELSLSSSQVLELDGVGAMEALTLLNLDGNHVRSLTPLAMHDNLAVLSLKDNEVTSLAEVDQLGTCFALRELSLVGNPVAMADHYRTLVAHLLPRLITLDGKPLSEAEKGRGRTMTEEDVESIAKVLRQRLEQVQEHTRGSADVSKQIINKSIERVLSTGSSISDDDGVSLIKARASISMYRVASARAEEFARCNPRKSNGNSHNLSEASVMEKFESTITTGAGGENKEAEEVEKSKLSSSTSSALTHGANVVFAGNLAASMRRRSRAARLETNKNKLKLVAKELSLNKPNSVNDPVDDLLGSGLVVEEDGLMQCKLDELLALSSGLEREFYHLQIPDNTKSESPKNKMLRRKSRKSSGSNSISCSSSTSSSNRRCIEKSQEVTVVEGVATEKEAKWAEVLNDESDNNSERPRSRQERSKPRSSSSGSSVVRKRSCSSAPRKSSSLNTAWKPAPPHQSKVHHAQKERKDADDMFSALSEFEHDLESYNVWDSE